MVQTAGKKDEEQLHLEQRRVYGARAEEQAVTKGMSAGDLLVLKIEQGRAG